MVFASPLFIFVFMPIFFIVYFLTNNQYKNRVLLIASLLFFLWGAPSFSFVIILSLVVDWQLGNLIFKYNAEVMKKKYFFVVSLILNIGMLGYFKYCNFFVDNINSLLRYFNIHVIEWTQVGLPIGISFLVFHKISYIIDVYRNVKKPTETISSYLIYILMFPMVIAGPIIKYQDIVDQIRKRNNSIDNIIQGLYRFVLGLTKKVWFADSFGNVADNIFSVPSGDVGFYHSWLGILCYTLQIYFDFSGYADMAIGLCKMMGFDIKENFNKPYISQNITEFWRRWHISLSNWMRDYIYIPLGGNRCSKFRNYFNLWVVFLISGLWHGASWTFVIWGAFHGLCIIFDKIFWLDFSKKIPRILNIFITFILIMFSWVLFRSETIDYALNFMRSMFSMFKQTVDPSLEILNISSSIYIMLLLGLIVVFIPMFTKFEKVVNKISWVKHDVFRIFIIVLLLILSISKCVSTTFSPFIYFRF
ncbi:MBOAT family O-acyltransferase [Paenibacillus sp. UMB4589-SE434]|uniref:MBOAT family O-acyltransferase n=1 Tax=Paenibacillus sp. UMB4589-SE434 TaxID=3046314 RepID=UPI00255102D6|nr:MBOAT family O-acyltransferase [Paenibacillus sp. UMB4589-SE434]MDK8181681.1 MBOAT family O-acyltransferase [Paenibacillus sp. UMB4589-SE434]